MDKIHCYGLILILTASGASAEEIDSATQTQVANAFADCYGVYNAFAEMYNTWGKPATAQTIKNMGNGALLAAEYILARDYNSRHKDPVVLEHFDTYVDGRATVAFTNLLSMIENEDSLGALAELEQCLSMSKFQEFIVQEIRDQTHGR